MNLNDRLTQLTQRSMDRTRNGGAVSRRPHLVRINGDWFAMRDVYKGPPSWQESKGPQKGSNDV